MEKTYQATRDIKLHTSVNLNGKQFHLAFTGGFTNPFRRNGIFTTSDKGLQEAIESDRSYGILFIRVNEEFKPIKPEPPEVNEKTEGKISPVEVNENKGEIKVIGDDVKNIQDAKKWLLDNIPGLLPEQVANKALALKVADSQKIKFTNIK